MKVLLVHPPPHKGIRVARIGRIQENYVPNIIVFFPLFLAHVAATLRAAGHSVGVIDAMAEDLSFVSTKGRMSRFNPDAVIVETVPTTFEGDIRIAEIAKQIEPEIHTIYYGLHATGRPKDVMADKNIDFVVRGEPEHTCLELINTLEGGGNLRGVKGLSFKENGVVRHNAARPFIDDLDELPHPARDVFPLEKYRVEPLGKITLVTASRGCPYYCCIFCASNLMDGNRLRSRHPKNVADEIESVVDSFNIRNIIFYSCNFCLWGDRNIMQFCKELLERNLNVRWLANSRVDTLPSESTLRYMARSGCFLLFFGVESGSFRMIRAMHKGRNVQECEEYVKAIEPAVKTAKRMGIFTHMSMLMGFSGENESTVSESVNMVKRAAPDLPVRFGIVRPLPGTILATIAERKGVLPPDGAPNSKDVPWHDNRKIASQLYAVINNSTSDKIVKLQKMANVAVRFSLTQKLKMLLKLLGRRDFDIVLNMIRLAIKEGTDINRIRFGIPLDADVSVETS